MGVVWEVLGVRWGSYYSGPSMYCSAKHLLPLFEECVRLPNACGVALPVAANDEFAWATSACKGLSSCDDYFPMKPRGVSRHSVHICW